MHTLELNYYPEIFKLNDSFSISRGTKNTAEIIKVEVTDGKIQGVGECTPNSRYKRNIHTELLELSKIKKTIEQNHRIINQNNLSELFTPSPARSAVDIALWDYFLKKNGLSIWDYFKIQRPQNLKTMITLDLSSLDKTMTRASKYNDYAIFKIKLDGTENDYSKIHNIRNLYPKKRVIVDANESIAARDLGRYLEYAERFNIEMIEQPMKVEFDFLLKDIKAKTIICADESCHISNDIEKISQYYDAINIKLDKSGGLTEAMNMVKVAQKKDLKIMSGCMLCTSLGIAASQIIAYHADYIDHDGPLFLEKDRDHALSYHIDRVSIARSYLWG